MQGAIRDEARRAARLLGFSGITLGMLALYTSSQKLLGSKDASARRDAWVRTWSHALMRLYGVSATWQGHDSPTTRGRLVVANHRSTIDIGLLLQRFGGRLVSRADLARWPILGQAAREVGTLFVDRDNAVSGSQTVRAIGNLLRAGETVCLFPEGRTFPDDPVRPFLAGSFVAATAAEADVIPVGIAYENMHGAAFVEESFGEHLLRMSKVQKTRVAITVGPAISSRDKRAKMLTEEVHTKVSELVRESRQLLSQTSV